jgi:hypothetical protein
VCEMATSPRGHAATAWRRVRAASSSECSPAVVVVVPELQALGWRWQHCRDEHVETIHRDPVEHVFCGLRETKRAREPSR